MIVARFSQVLIAAVAVFVGVFLLYTGAHLSQQGATFALGIGFLTISLLGLLGVTLDLFTDHDLPSSDFAPLAVPSVDLTSNDAAKALVYALPAPALLADEHGVVVIANQDVRDIFSTLKEQQPLSFAIRRPELISAIQSVFSGDDYASIEFKERVPLERHFMAEVRRLDFVSAQKNHFALVMLRDLTKEQSLERMRVDFVANASHELKTPIASIMGFIETLQGAAKDDAKARDRFLDIMRSQAIRMTRLIDDLLSLSRVEMKAHLPPQDIVDLKKVVLETLDTLRPIAEDSGVKIEFVCDPEGLYKVRGDTDELMRVSDNLVSNGLKYGQSGERLVVTLARHVDEDRNASVVLAVRDFGPGIPPEHLPRLTERFYRANMANSREKKGTGLGLALVKHIVSRHKGRLIIKSELGDGAMFAVSVPAYNSG